MRDTCGHEEFASHPALFQCVGVCTRLDICANIQHIAPGSEKTTPEELMTLKKTIDHIRIARDM